MTRIQVQDLAVERELGRDESANVTGGRHRRHRHGGGHHHHGGGHGHGHGHGHGGFHGAWGFYSPWYHDTSHYDWVPGRYVWHNGHLDYIPGHYVWHQTGHLHW